jgi:hypothetical protein
MPNAGGAMFKQLFRGIVNSTLQTAVEVNNRMHHYDLQDTWVVSGTPRSGTTWLAEVLLSAEKDARLLWEPLRGRNNAALRGMNFPTRLFLDVHEECNPATHQFLERVLLGETLNHQTLRLKTQPRNGRYVLGKGRWIVKFVRGNGVLGYLYKHFGIPKPVVIIRHPCAVVASQRRMGGWQKWGNCPEIAPDLSKYSHIDDAIKGAKSLEEVLAITWAGDALTALMHNDYLQIVYYEDLVLHGPKVLEKIFSTWGMKVPEPCLSSLRNPSSSWKPWSIEEQGLLKLKEWQEPLEPETAKLILETVQKMGVDIYDDGIIPKHSSFSSE